MSHQFQHFTPVPENTLQMIVWYLLNSIATRKTQHRFFATKVKLIKALFPDIPEHYKALTLYIQRTVYFRKQALSASSR